MGKRKAKETKKEHYVPKCYLERWKSNKGQVFVYDKLLKISRVNNVNDIACERYFYDIDYKELSEQKIVFLKGLGIEPTQDEQFIEHFLSGHVEGAYSELLKKIIDKEITPWYEKNCFFISQEDKLNFSVCIAFQYIRTMQTRRMLSDMSNCLEQVFGAMNVSDDFLKKYAKQEGEEKIIQGNMLLDIEHIFEMTISFFNLTWILGMNKTSRCFYTSDNPIGTKAHVKHPFMSMAGIKSEGVEVYFPLSPNHILLMYDGEYHKALAPYDRKYISVNEIEMVKHYNSYGVHNSNRCLFSQDGDYALIKEMLKENPDIFEIPKMQVSWGGKSFFPKDKEKKEF